MQFFEIIAVESPWTHNVQMKNRLKFKQPISPRLKLLVFEFNEKQIQLSISHAAAVHLMDAMSGEKESLKMTDQDEKD